jgi:hypothetical protein
LGTLGAVSLRYAAEEDMLPKITALRVHAVNGRGEFGTGFFNKGSELVGGTSRTSPVTAACSGDGFYAGF